MAGGFNQNTRLKFIELPSMGKPTGGGIVQVQLPKTGLIARIWLNVTGSISGTLSGLNPLGKASIIKRVSVIANSGLSLFSASGAGIHYGLSEMMESEYFTPWSVASARAAVATGAFDLSCVIPIALNLRDALGLVMLQNEQTILTLQVEFETDSVVATGATVTATVYPRLELFTVPQKVEDWPPLGTIHQIVEDSQSVSAAGDFTYNYPRGNVLLQAFHGLGIGAAGSDGFSAFKLRVNQSEYLTVASRTQHLDLEHYFYTGRARPAGGIYVDFMRTSGLGTYGMTRDLFNTGAVTDFAGIITATGNGTLYTLRRQLVVLQ